MLFPDLLPKYSNEYKNYLKIKVNTNKEINFLIYKFAKFEELEIVIKCLNHFPPKGFRRLFSGFMELKYNISLSEFVKNKTISKEQKGKILKKRKFQLLKILAKSKLKTDYERTIKFYNLLYDMTIPEKK